MPVETANHPIENISRISSSWLARLVTRRRHAPFPTPRARIRGRQPTPAENSMAERTCLAIVLAAGEGTRMRSARPKVLHAVAGQSMLAHVLNVVPRAGGSAVAVVVGPQSDAVSAEARRVVASAEILSNRSDAAHAVLAAADAIARGLDDILVIFGDTPLLRPQTLVEMRCAGSRRGDRRTRLPPHRPDRLRTAGARERRACAIREENDANAAERADRAVQWRIDGVCRGDGAVDPQADRQCTTARVSST